MPTIAERLGYPADATLLIIHCDDFGMCHSENVATMKALQEGWASSASIMVPCPWRDEAIAFARDHPELDIGMHSTVTSEWDVYRWGPVSPREDVPSLVDENGYLWKWEEPFAAHADPADVETELRAQYALLTSRGVQPTHIDMHMAALSHQARYFDVYTGLAREFRLPFMFPDPARAYRELYDPEYERVSKATEAALQEQGLFVLDRIYIQVQAMTPEACTAHYVSLIRGLEPGLHQIILHVAQDDAEIRAAAIRDGLDEYSYRIGDYAMTLDAGVRAAIDDEGVTLLTWREVGRALYG